MRIILSILIGIGLIFAYIKYLEYKGVYYPDKGILIYPSSAGMSFKDIYITAEDNVRINGWFISNPKAKYTLLFFHGNAGNIGDRIDKLQLLYREGLNIFIKEFLETKGDHNSAFLDSQELYISSISTFMNKENK